MKLEHNENVSKYLNYGERIVPKSKNIFFFVKIDLIDHSDKLQLHSLLDPIFSEIIQALGLE
jgi:hypothetical protein